MQHQSIVLEKRGLSLYEKDERPGDSFTYLLHFLCDLSDREIEGEVVCKTFDAP